MNKTCLDAEQNPGHLLDSEGSYLLPSTVKVFQKNPVLIGTHLSHLLTLWMKLGDSVCAHQTMGFYRRTITQNLRAGTLLYSSNL